ncbi:hypothetical protein LY78DRAFT_87666 [Colletotrichum sublineola]|nr:hypothetical protein LY78DRAFT_87666 [Colletotrichum sublineola]
MITKVDIKFETRTTSTEAHGYHLARGTKGKQKSSIDLFEAFEECYSKYGSGMAFSNTLSKFLSQTLCCSHVPAGVCHSPPEAAPLLAMTISRKRPSLHWKEGAKPAPSLLSSIDGPGTQRPRKRFGRRNALESVRRLHRMPLVYVLLDSTRVRLIGVQAYIH